MLNHIKCIFKIYINICSSPFNKSDKFKKQCLFVYYFFCRLIVFTNILFRIFQPFLHILPALCLVWLVSLVGSRSIIIHQVSELWVFLPFLGSAQLNRSSQWGLSHLYSTSLLFPTENYIVTAPACSFTSLFTWLVSLTRLQTHGMSRMWLKKKLPHLFK